MGHGRFGVEGAQTEVGSFIHEAAILSAQREVLAQQEVPTRAVDDAPLAWLSTPATSVLCVGLNTRAPPSASTYGSSADGRDWASGKQIRQLPGVRRFVSPRVPAGRSTSECYGRIRRWFPRPASG